MLRRFLREENPSIGGGKCCGRERCATFERGQEPTGAVVAALQELPPLPAGGGQCPIIIIMVEGERPGVQGRGGGQSTNGVGENN